ncbi:MAG: hypothetical protein GY937_05840 [bacterium]|nr:hypothetical protein [bacterium]
MSSTRQPQPGLRAVALALAPVIYLLLAPASAFGQIPAGPAAEEAAGTSQPLSLEERRSRALALQAEIRGEIAALDESPVATATPAGSDFVTHKRIVLERLESLAGSQLALLDTRTALERSLAEAEQHLAGGPATVVEDDPPFSLESYDAIAAVVAREVRALQAARRARRDAARNLDAARGELERRQSERRLAVDAIELATTKTEEAQRRRAAEFAALA